LPDFFPEAKGFTYLAANEFSDLAQIIKRVVSETPSTNSLAQNFSWDQITKRLSGVYRNIAGAAH